MSDINWYGCERGSTRGLTHVRQGFEMQMDFDALRAMSHEGATAGARLRGASSLWLMLVILSSARGAEPDSPDAVRLLKGDNYTVTWDTPATYPPDAELEIGGGSGHGGSLYWFRFRTGPRSVSVLSIRLDEGWHPFKSKWPPDRAPVVVKTASFERTAFVKLLHEIAVVDSATLKLVESDRHAKTTNNTWYYACLPRNTKDLTWDWAGYEGNNTVDFVKPKAAVSLARQAVESLEFSDHALTDDERAWASAKFARDWKKFKGLSHHWWVRERYLTTIGVVGNRTALPTLREVLAAEDSVSQPPDPSDKRCVYQAINAVTRLTNTDVRPMPVEEMDIQLTRKRVLELIDQAR